MTETEQFKYLLKLLDEAEILSSQFSGGYSNAFWSAEEFHKALSESVEKLKNGDTDEINKLCVWFAPTCSWDDFVGLEGANLGDKIYTILIALKKSWKVYGLFEVIRDYQNAVEKVISAFKKKYERTDLLTALDEKLYPREGELSKFGIKRYAFHGIGLHATFNDNSTVDFDFAFLPDRRHDGFDLWRLQAFINDQPTKYVKFLEKERLKREFEALIEKGIIVNPSASFPTSLYFFRGALVPVQKSKKWSWKFWKFIDA